MLLTQRGEDAESASAGRKYSTTCETASELRRVGRAREGTRTRNRAGPLPSAASHVDVDVVRSSPWKAVVASDVSDPFVFGPNEKTKYLAICRRFIDVQSNVTATRRAP